MAKLQVFERTATHHNKGFQVNAKMLIKISRSLHRLYRPHSAANSSTCDEVFA